MDIKEFKKYKHELKHRTPLQKVGHALGAQGHVLGKIMDTHMDVSSNRVKRMNREFKENVKNIVAKRMKRD